MVSVTVEGLKSAIDICLVSEEEASTPKAKKSASKNKEAFESLKEIKSEEAFSKSDLGAYNPATGRAFSGNEKVFQAALDAGLSGQFAGFKQWKELGRSVKKGAKGFSIMTPSMKKTKDDGEAVSGFFRATVFAIEQTDKIED